MAVKLCIRATVYAYYSYRSSSDVCDRPVACAYYVVCSEMVRLRVLMELIDLPLLANRIVSATNQKFY